MAQAGRYRRSIAATVLAAGVAVSGCSRTHHDEAAGEAAHVVPLGNSGISRVTLDAQAARRLDLQTAPVDARGGRTVIPYSAVLYEADGDAFVYVSPAPLTFQRAAIKVERIAADAAILADGPPAGTKVVTRAAQEVYGTEFGVDE